MIPEESTVQVRARSSIHPIEGKARGLEGRIEFDLANRRPDLNRPVAASVAMDVAGLSSGNLAVSTEMKRRLDQNRFPKISGSLTGVRQKTESVYEVEGDLTFHGATRRVQTDIEIRLESDRLYADWEQIVDITDFEVKAPRILMFRVEPEVNVEVHLVAEQVEKSDS